MSSDVGAGNRLVFLQPNISHAVCIIFVLLAVYGFKRPARQAAIISRSLLIAFQLIFWMNGESLTMLGLVIATPFDVVFLYPSSAKVLAFAIVINFFMACHHGISGTVFHISAVVWAIAICLHLPILYSRAMVNGIQIVQRMQVATDTLLRSNGLFPPGWAHDSTVENGDMTGGYLFTFVFFLAKIKAIALLVLVIMTQVPNDWEESMAWLRTWLTVTGICAFVLIRYFRTILDRILYGNSMAGAHCLQYLGDSKRWQQSNCFRVGRFFFPCAVLYHFYMGDTTGFYITASIVIAITLCYNLWRDIHLVNTCVLGLFWMLCDITSQEFGPHMLAPSFLLTISYGIILMPGTEYIASVGMLHLCLWFWGFLNRPFFFFWATLSLGISLSLQTAKIIDALFQVVNIWSNRQFRRNLDLVYRSVVVPRSESIFKGSLAARAC